jgi:hypothetical protein
VSAPGFAPVRSLVRIPVKIPVTTLVDAFGMGFEELSGRPACICAGFMRYNLKTHTNSHLT